MDAEPREDRRTTQPHCAWLVLLALLLPTGVSADARADPPRRQALILNSYHDDFTWSDGLIRGIKETLPADVDLTIEHLDAKRYQGPEHLDLVLRTLRYKFAQRRFAVVIACDDDAFQLALHFRDELFPDTPVVFCGVNSFSDDMVAGRDWITGVVETNDPPGTLRLIMQVLPDVREVLAITDNTHTGSINRARLENMRAQEALPVTLRFLDSSTLDSAELLAAVRAAPPDSAIYYLDFFRDRRGQFVQLEVLMPELTRSSPVPVFVHGEMYVGRGVVGGKVTTSVDNGRVAGRLATRLLEGATPSELPIQREGPYSYLFDYPQLARWGIPLNRLPTESTFVNRPFSFYQTYRALIWTTAGVVALLTLTTVVLAVNTLRRRRAERALRESEGRYRQLVDGAPIGIVTHADGRILFANAAAARLAGAASAAELRDRTVLDFVPPEQRAAVEQRLANVRTPPLQAVTEEQQLLRLDGTPVDTEVAATVITVGGRPAMQLLITDITERRRAATERARLEAELRQAQKMEAIGQLAGGVAHDFNNILTVISGHAELADGALRQAPPALPLAQTCVAEVERAVARAAALTRRLLVLSRRDVAQPVVLDLNRALRDMEPMLRRVIRESITFDVRLADAVPPIHIDAGQLEQAVLNLVLNARDAMPGGGRLTLATQRVELDAAYVATHADARAGPHAVLSVSDTGCGIDAATLERIFEPFFTTKPAGQGTGLGLSTVHGVVKQAGGHAVVTSTPGTGTTFHLHFPAVDGSDPPAPRPAGNHMDAPTGHETVLLCEDDDTIREMAGRVLRDAGYTVLTAAAGPAAIACAEAHAGPLDVLVTDVIMPDMHGRELADTLRVARPDLRVLYISGYASDVISHHGVLDEGIQFLEKPFTRPVLLQRVRALLDAS